MAERTQQKAKSRVVLRVGITLAVLLGLLTLAALLPAFSYITQESEEAAFRRYVLPSIPPGVSVVKKGGVVSLGGGDEWVVLSFSKGLTVAS